MKKILLILAVLMSCSEIPNTLEPYEPEPIDTTIYYHTLTVTCDANNIIQYELWKQLYPINKDNDKREFVHDTTLKNGTVKYHLERGTYILIKYNLVGNTQDKFYLKSDTTKYICY